MSFDLHYRHGTKYGNRFPRLTFGCAFTTRERAEACRQLCINADQIEVVEVPDDAA